MLPNEHKKCLSLSLFNIRNDKLNSASKYKLCELLKTSLFRFCILYLWDLCRQGQAMCYATLTAQIPQIFCEQAEKEEVCRREPAFSYWSGILSPALFDKQNNHFYPLFHFGMIRVEKTWKLTNFFYHLCYFALKRAENLSE